MRSAQHWDPDRYQRNAGFVAELGLPVLDLLALRPGEDVLDLGCGDGALTEKLVAAGARVVAVDASPHQIGAARQRGLDARVEDATALPFHSAFDAVFSNAALHWVKDADAAIVGVARALRHGGRFVAEMGGAGNCEAVRRALHAGLTGRGIDPRSVDPWYFPTEAEYGDKLRDAGFAIEHMALIPRPTPLPGDIIGWLNTFAEDFLNTLPADGRDDFLAELRDKMRPQLCDKEGRWSVDYVRLRFAARLRA